MHREVGIGIPDDWPVVDQGLYMGYLGRVLVVHADASADDRVFERHVRELERAIVARFESCKIGVLYDVPSLRNVDARRRKRVADLLAAYDHKLRRTTAAYAFCTPSVVARGIIRAVFWLSPPPYPHSIEGTPLDGFRFIVSHLPGVDPDALHAEYRALLRQALDATGS